MKLLSALCLLAAWWWPCAPSGPAPTPAAEATRAPGLRLVLQLQPTPVVPTITPALQRQVRAILATRFQALAQGAVAIAPEGEDQLSLHLSPGMDHEQVIRVATTPALLSFRARSADWPEDAGEGAIDGWVPTGLDGAMLSDATPGRQQEAWIVHTYFTPAGQTRFEAVTRALQDRPLGIFLDGTMIASPIVRMTIDRGYCAIDGDFTRERARELAAMLTAGSLPVPFELAIVE